jgi:demethylmenaquinone methyltransferase/2-methoxy-6-polyprenyl-1,4-benzoquinol methylase
VGSALVPGGTVFFIDSLYSETSTAVDHALEERKSTTSVRTLNDGRRFRIVKIFYDPDDLMKRLAELGWRVTIQTTANYFLYGYGKKRT